MAEHRHAKKLANARTLWDGHADSGKVLQQLNVVAKGRCQETKRRLRLEESARQGWGDARSGGFDLEAHAAA